MKSCCKFNAKRLFLDLFANDFVNFYEMRRYPTGVEEMLFKLTLNFTNFEKCFLSHAISNLQYNDFVKKCSMFNC